MAIIRIASFQDLTTFMTEAKLPYEADAEQRIVVTPTNKPPLTGQLLLRWEKQLPYVQAIQAIVKDVPADRRADIEQAICIANNTIALPGLGYDHASSVVYFRLTIPMYEEGMLAATFVRQINAVISNARDFLVPFQQVVNGQPGAKILELAVAFAQAQAQAAGK